MPLLALMRFALRVISGGFMVAGCLGTIGGLWLVTSPDAVVTINGIETKAIGPKILLLCAFAVVAGVGWLLWAHGQRVALGFIERAMEEREE